jgi:hypothetical protein
MRAIALALPVTCLALASGSVLAQQNPARQPTPELQALDDAGYADQRSVTDGLGCIWPWPIA